MQQRARCVVVRGLRRKLATVAVPMLLLGVACGAEDAFVDVGNANGEAFRVEVASIQRDGDIVHYRVFSKAPPRLRLQMDYEGRIAVDCAKRLRVAYVNITRFERGTSRSTNDPADMKSVFNGTRQAEELEIVCALARGNPAGGALQMAPTSPPQPAPAPKVTAARLMSTAIGIVVSTSGHVVVSSRVTAGCASLVAVVGGRREHAELLATDNGMALLKMAATVSTPLAGSPRPVAAGAPVTVLGYPPQAKPGAEPVVAAAVVRGGADPARVVDLAFASAAAVVEGAALGEQGELVGFVTPAGGAQPSTHAIPGARVRAFLEQQGVAWPAVGRERPLPCRKSYVEASPAQHSWRATRTSDAPLGRTTAQRLGFAPGQAQQGRARVIVGIDLGTTNSLIAVWRDGQAQLIKNALGEALTPSCVSLDDDGTVLVGRAARERLQTHPDRTASVFKRYMGSSKTLRLGKREFRPEELSALILKSLKADAEAALGEPVTEAIITVPAYFSDAQRKATRAAGQIAGLKVERLLNEPTAAALAYGIHLRGAESRFLVFDLGGGTFDVSILELFEGVMEVRASAGDNFLGGEDVVQALCNHFFDGLRLPESLRKDDAFMQRLSAQAEAAKRALSTQPKAAMRVRRGNEEHVLHLDEPALEQVCAPLLKRLRAPVERALRDANLRSSELDNIVLAGGATRMPLVRRLVTTMFGRFPAVDLNPDEVVALGAAVQAGLKAKDAALEEVVMTDVSPYSLGVEVGVKLDERAVSQGHFDPVIERNTPVPVSRVKQYAPQNEGQSFIELQIYQGEARMVRDNIHLGSLKVPLPRAPVPECGVDVRFTYDVNGLLQVEATVRKTAETASVVIEGNPGLLSDEEIAQRLRALADLKIHPRDRLEHRTLMARGERLYEQFRGDEREWLGAQLLRFERVLATQDERVIAPARREFESLLNRVERDSFLDGAPH